LEIRRLIREMSIANPERLGTADQLERSMIAVSWIRFKMLTDRLR
jgi:hypothetical protein